MGKIKACNPVKLIIGFIFNKRGYFIAAKNILEKKFGKIDFESQILPFNLTGYYKKEFGNNLKRSFVSFSRLIKPEDLPKIKIAINKIEERLSVEKKRQINIDPGYLELSKLVLATSKDYSHRIYLGKGIFGEVTLYYRNATFTPWEWTYPDYKTEAYIQIFNQIRATYARQIK